MYSICVLVSLIRVRANVYSDSPCWCGVASFFSTQAQRRNVYFLSNCGVA